jgi:hypothetical protein
MCILSLLSNGSIKFSLSFLGNVTAATKTQATTKELLGLWSSLQPDTYQGEQAISSSQNFFLIL